MVYRDVKYDLSRFSRQSVLEHLLAKMKIQFTKNMVKPAYVNIFFCLNEESLLLEFIRAYKKSK